MTSESADLVRLFEESRTRNAAAEAFYALLKRRGELASHRVLTFRCRRRCLLADVLRTTSAVLVHLPRYKLSPVENERSSSPEGRAANTEDGDHRWRGHTVVLDAEPSTHLLLTCDHVLNHRVSTAEVLAAVERGTPEIVVP